MHFHFKTDFLYSKNTQNVRKILDLNPQNTLLTQFFFWAPAAAKENSDDEFLQGKFVAWSFDFSSKRQLSIFFNFHFSLV